MENHRLESELARRGRREQPVFDADLDQYLVEMDKRSIQLANWFAQVWMGVGYESMRLKLTAEEALFDEADLQCRPEGGDQAAKAAPDIEAARMNCRSLQRLFEAVGSLGIKVAAPAPTIFKHDPTLKSRGEQWLLEDTKQLRLDSAAKRPEEITQHLMQDDRRLIDCDREVWLMEIGAADVRRFNERFPGNRLTETDKAAEIMAKLRQRMAAIFADARAKLLGSR